MKSETYDQIWQQIDESAQNIFQRLEPEGHDFRFVYGDNGKKIIWKEYNRIREELKSRCYAGSATSKADDHLIDHHKIAACLCMALINRKLFTFTMSEDISGDMLRSKAVL